MVNIHYAAAGAEGPVYPRTGGEARVVPHGCTVHFVRSEMGQRSDHRVGRRAGAARDTADSLARVLAAEHRLYPMALRLIAEGKVSVADERVAVRTTAAGGMLFNPLGALECAADHRRDLARASGGGDLARADAIDHYTLILSRTPGFPAGNSRRARNADQPASL